MAEGDWPDGLAEWWLDEVESDASYRRDVIPMAVDLVEPALDRTYIDLGCGDGGLMAAIVDAGGRSLGLDASLPLALRASTAGPVVVARLPDMACLRDDAVDGAILSLVIDHLDGVGMAFAAASRIVRRGGLLVVVANHPLITAPGSAPIVDPDDGEVLWRWGTYLSAGHTDHQVGAERVRFRHHPLGELLTAAAAAGWCLERMMEAAITPPGDPTLAAQAEIPRLLGLRWRLATEPG